MQQVYSCFSFDTRHILVLLFSWRLSMKKHDQSQSPVVARIRILVRLWGNPPCPYREFAGRKERYLQYLEDERHSRIQMSRMNPFRRFFVSKIFAIRFAICRLRMGLPMRFLMAILAPCHTSSQASEIPERNMPARATIPDELCLMQFALNSVRKNLR